MRDHLTGSEIHNGTGLPREYVSCPGCGFVYGYQKRKACIECDQCVKCCSCPDPKLISGKDMLARAASQV